MFTGIIEKLGRVIGTERHGGGGSVQIESGWALTDVGLGDSISVNGACLTVSSLRGGVFGADVSGETLRRTNLGDLNTGEQVNLERALRLSDRLGGHLLTGHIDGTGTVREAKREGDSFRYEFDVPEQISRGLVEKGSVAVDGISLTVGRWNGSSLQVYVIPYTLEKTTLQFRRPGDRVNIETDILGKYVEKMLSSRKDGLSLETLKESGFL
jgi:riboflavin synthase